MRAPETACLACALAWMSALWIGACKDPREAPVIGKITVTAPSPVQPSSAPEPPASAPQPAAPAAPEPEAPTNVRGRDAETFATSAAGSITVRFHVHDPCDATHPRVTIDLEARTIAIAHKDRAMRCGGGQLDYKTIVEGLPAGTFEVTAPGLPRARVRVPSSAASIAPKARSLDVTPKREPHEVLEF